MPIDQWLQSYQPGDEFDFDAFRAQALEEAEKDRNAANAAISTRDTELASTKAELTKAQAAAWELYNGREDGDAGRQPEGDPDPNSLAEIRKRVFKPLNK